MSPFLKQVWCVSAALVSIFVQGVVVGYTSFLLAAVRDPDSPISVDLHLASFLSSSLGPSYLIGQIISSILMEVIGRRTTFIIVQIPGFLGWLLIYFAGNYAVLLIGRLLTEISVGCVAGFSAILIAEYTDPKHRGMFLSLKMASFNLGTTTTHTVLGYYFHWRTIALIATAPYVTAALIAFTWPESPAWLASKLKYTQCRADFFKLRERTDSAVWEIEELIAAQKDQQSKANGKTTFIDRLKCFVKKFALKDFLKPILIFILGSILIEASGRHYFPAYAVTIMGEIAGTGAAQRNCTLVLDLLAAGSALAAVPLLRVTRRRTLLFFSGISSLVVLAPSCILLYLISSGVLSPDYQMVPVSLLISFFVLVNLGCNPVPFALSGEIFPVQHRSAASAFSAFLAFVLLSLTMHFTPFSLLYLKVHGTLAVYGGLMLVSLAGLYFALPETKDRTLQEIEDFFQNGRFGTPRLPKEENLKMIVLQDI